MHLQGRRGSCRGCGNQGAISKGTIKKKRSSVVTRARTARALQSSRHGLVRAGSDRDEGSHAGACKEKEEILELFLTPFGGVLRDAWGKKRRSFGRVDVRKKIESYVKGLHHFFLVSLERFSKRSYEKKEKRDAIHRGLSFISCKGNAWIRWFSWIAMLELRSYRDPRGRRSILDEVKRMRRNKLLASRIVSKDLLFLSMRM